MRIPQRLATAQSLAAAAVCALCTLSPVNVSAAIRFDTDGEGYTRTSGVVDYNSNYTMMAWFKLNSFNAGSNWTVFFSPNSNSTSQDYDEIGVNGADNPTTQLFADKAGTSCMTAGTMLSTGTWYHIAAVRSSTTALNLFLNGASDASTCTQSVSSRSAATRLDMGTFTSSAIDNLDGSTACVKIWTTNLSQAEIQNELRTCRPLRTTNLYLWSTALSTSDDETDYSGNGRNWTVSGTLSTEDGPPVGW